jgi:hypothetical protein
MDYTSSDKIGNVPADIVSGGQGWISWLMQNRLVLIIVLILFVIIVIPWLVCDVLGLKPLCSIISGIFNLISKLFSSVGL